MPRTPEEVELKRLEQLAKRHGIALAKVEAALQRLNGAPGGVGDDLGDTDGGEG